MSQQQPVAWQYRFICPEEGAGLWQPLEARHVDLIASKANHEVRALHVRPQPLSRERLMALGIDEATARLIEQEHGIEAQAASTYSMGAKA